MSEYQYVAFRAIENPVSEKNLAYMQQQSSRAEITPWSFDNEYHYGDFRGNAKEMLRRGYDLHVHYANFGVRTVMVRFPNGLADPKAVKPYFAVEGLRLLKDKEGPGRILSIAPLYESDELPELWEINDVADRLVPLRAEILDGDLRPLYLAHLAVACDDEHDGEETIEAPVPAGLGNLTAAQCALAELFGLDDMLIAAAAQESPPLRAKADAAPDYATWLHDQPTAKKNAWLASLMADRNSAVRAEILGKFRKQRDTPTWATAQPNRTIDQLRTMATGLAEAADRKAVALAERKRAKRLVDMAADPAKTLRETEMLVAERTTKAYSQIGELLAELREALSASGQSGLAEKQAQKLKAANPTLRTLTSELRRRGFLPK